MQADPRCSSDERGGLRARLCALLASAILCLTVLAPASCAEDYSHYLNDERFSRLYRLYLLFRERTQKEPEKNIPEPPIEKPEKIIFTASPDEPTLVEPEKNIIEASPDESSKVEPEKNIFTVSADEQPLAEPEKIIVESSPDEPPEGGPLKINFQSLIEELGKIILEASADESPKVEPEKNILDLPIESSGPESQKNISAASADEAQLPPPVAISDDMGVDAPNSARAIIDRVVDLYRVVRGDCLWRISRRFYGLGALWPRIFNENTDKIRDPDLIYPDQELAIPPASRDVGR